MGWGPMGAVVNAPVRNSLRSDRFLLTFLFIINLLFRWSEEDFMFHGWKKNYIDEWDSPFKSEVDLNLCGDGLRAWHWHEDKRLKPAEMR